jgi:hypothetical protein
MVVISESDHDVSSRNNRHRGRGSGRRGFGERGDGGPRLALVLTMVREARSLARVRVGASFVGETSARFPHGGAGASLRADPGSGQGQTLSVVFCGLVDT